MPGTSYPERLTLHTARPTRVGKAASRVASVACRPVSVPTLLVHTRGSHTDTLPSVPPHSLHPALAGDGLLGPRDTRAVSQFGSALGVRGVEGQANPWQGVR